MFKKYVTVCNPQLYIVKYPLKTSSVVKQVHLLYKFLKFEFGATIYFSLFVTRPYYIR